MTHCLCECSLSKSLEPWPVEMTEVSPFGAGFRGQANDDLTEVYSYEAFTPFVRRLKAIQLLL